MAKRKPIILLAVLLITALSFMGLPHESQAQSKWQYAAVSYLEMDLLGGFNPCVWVATECSNEKGSSCTKIGSKSRGLLYCALPHLENVK